MRSKERKRKNKVPDGFSRVFNSEKTVIRNLLNNFVVNGSRGEELIKEITDHCDLKTISLKSILSIAKIISDLINEPISRNTSRNKKLIIKWFDDNEGKISLCKEYIKPSFIKKL